MPQENSPIQDRFFLCHNHKKDFWVQQCSNPACRIDMARSVYYEDFGRQHNCTVVGRKAMPQENSRDPRIDPRKGDILCVEGRVREVTHQEDSYCVYRFQFGWKTYTPSLKHWRRWAANAKVIRRAE